MLELQRCYSVTWPAPMGDFPFAPGEKELYAQVRAVLAEQAYRQSLFDVLRYMAAD